MPTLKRLLSATLRKIGPKPAIGSDVKPLPSITDSLHADIILGILQIVSIQMFSILQIG